MDHPLDLGEQVTEDFLVAGHRGRAVWTVLEREAPERWVIAGEVNGRKAGAITYTLTPSGRGTRFDREFVYSSPSLLFAVLNRVSVRAEVERESAEAVRRLKQILESTARRAGETRGAAPQPDHARRRRRGGEAGASTRRSGGARPARARRGDLLPAGRDRACPLAPGRPARTRRSPTVRVRRRGARPQRARAEVDAILEEARAAGARILKSAHETFWGEYAGYFADPDGHPWEIAWNPHFALGADGSLRLPD